MNAAARPRILPPLRLPRDRGDGPLVSAHRGGLRIVPENTMAAFRSAVELGATMIELDVHPTRDGELAVIHDVTTERTTGQGVRVQDATMAELSVLDAGSHFASQFADERIPTLEHVLRWARGRAYVNVDVRHFPFFTFYEAERTIGSLLRAIDAADVGGEVIIQCPDHVLAAEVSRRRPDVIVGVTQHGRPVDPVAIARSAGAQVVSGDTEYLTRDMVEQLHAAGIAVMTSVELRLPGRRHDPADSAAVIERLLALGTDIIVTDDVAATVLTIRQRRH